MSEPSPKVDGTQQWDELPLPMTALRCYVSDCAVGSSHAFSNNTTSTNSDHLAYECHHNRSRTEDETTVVSERTASPVKVISITKRQHQWHPAHDPPSAVGINGLDSIDSMASIISAITLPDSLTCSKENSQVRFSKNTLRDALPKFPIRQGSVFTSTSSVISGVGSVVSASSSSRQNMYKNKRPTANKGDSSPIIPERKSHEKNKVYSKSSWGKALRKVIATCDAATTITIVPLERTSSFQR